MAEVNVAETNITEVVKEKYGQAALRAKSGGRSSCCGTTVASGPSCGCDPITSNLYDSAQTVQLPQEAVLASLGCGNPTALAQLNPGEIVLDLGSGGGIDVLLSAKCVGPSGKAYGLDMTKARVLREAFRVLKPGGRFAVSDVVTHGEINEEIRKNVLLWVGCVAGALDETEYRDKLAAAGFERINIEPTRIYRAEDAQEFLSEAGIDVDAIAPQVDGKFMSAFVRAVKPTAIRDCCGPTCCTENM